MLYRVTNNVLVIEQQLLDGRGALQRVARALQDNRGILPTDITWTRAAFGLRPAIQIRFPSNEAAEAAEVWFEKEFEL